MRETKHISIQIQPRVYMKRIYKYSSLLIIGLVLPLTLSAHTLGDDVNEIVRKTKQLYSGTKTAKITFKQEGSAGDATGTLEYSSGNKFRLTLPSQTIISNGKKTW